MITVPTWWAVLIVVCILFGPAAVAAVVAFRLAAQRADRILDEELYHPPVSDQEASDRADRGQSDG